MNLAQSFNPIGSIAGVFLSKWFILSGLNQADTEARAAMSAEQLQRIQSEELAAVMGPYVGIALVLSGLWVCLALIKMPKASDTGGARLVPTFKRLLRNRNWTWGVVAQFFYVGAQIGVWSFTIRYVMAELRLNEEQASSYYIASLILFAVSRFVCTALMRVLNPGVLLTVLAAAAAGCTLVVIYGQGYAGVYALVAISGCMSLMFPTIFGLAVRGLGDDTKIGGSGPIMAILGGAALTAAQGQVSDATGSIHAAYWVPLVCFLVVACYGAAGCRQAAAPRR